MKVSKRGRTTTIRFDDSKEDQEFAFVLMEAMKDNYSGDYVFPKKKEKATSQQKGGK